MKLTRAQWAFILTGLAGHLVTLSGLHWADFTKVSTVIGIIVTLLTLIGGTLNQTPKED